VLDAVAAWAAPRQSVAAVDLACGLGSTLRAVTGRLPKRQNWRLVDNDLSLLARAGDLARPPDSNGHDRAGRSRARSEAALDGPVEVVTNLGAARSGVARMAGAARHRGGGAAAPGLCGAEL